MVGWRFQVLRAGAVAAMLLAAVPAHAAEQPLAPAQKAMASGKPDLAIRALTAALAGSALKGGDIARAYLLRGQANAKAGHDAAAISDFNTALYLKGLSETDRQAALAAKAEAYKKAGVAAAGGPAKPAAAEPATVPVPNLDAVVTTEPPAKPVKKAAKPAAAEQTASADPLPWQGAAAKTPAPPAPASAPVSAPAADGDGENPVNAVLGSLFSFGQTSPAPAPAAAEPAPAATATTAPAPAAAPVWKTAGLSPDAERPAKAAKASGGLYLQVASLRTTGEAQVVADKLSADHATALGGLSPSITPTVLGNMGTFYAVRLGPVASKAAGTTVCARLRKEGVDCFFATP